MNTHIARINKVVKNTCIYPRYERLISGINKRHRFIYPGYEHTYVRDKYMVLVPHHFIYPGYERGRSFFGSPNHTPPHRIDPETIKMDTFLIKKLIRAGEGPWEGVSKSILDGGRQNAGFWWKSNCPETWQIPEIFENTGNPGTQKVQNPWKSHTCTWQKIK